MWFKIFRLSVSPRIQRDAQLRHPRRIARELTITKEKKTREGVGRGRETEGLPHRTPRHEPRKLEADFGCKGGEDRPFDLGEHSTVAGWPSNKKRIESQRVVRAGSTNPGEGYRSDLAATILFREARARALI